MVYRRFSFLLGSGLIGIIFVMAQPTYAVTATDVTCFGCVGTIDIVSNAITTSRLGNNSVTTNKIYDGTVSNNDISSTAAIDPTKILGTAWTANNDGSGTNLDADYLDGLTSSQFLRADQSGSLMGSLGIGTTSPIADLDIAGRFLVNASTSSPDAWSISVGDGTGWKGHIINSTGTKLITFQDNGSVGIGTTDPVYKLDINSQTSRIASNSYDGITFEKQAYPNEGSLLFSSDRSGYNFSIGNKRQSDGNVLPIITLMDTGDVGIGTTTPIGALTVDTADQVGAVIGDVSGGDAADTLTEVYVGYGTSADEAGVVQWNDADKNLSIMVSGDTKSLVLADGGNVGIGTTTPENKLEIESGHIGLDSDYGLIWGSGGDAEYVRRPAGVDSLTLGTQNTERVRIDASGNVGVGTTSPSQKLDVQGNIVATGTICGSTGCVGDSSSQWTTSGSSIYYTSGNVGIGTSSPSSSLEVTGQIKANNFSGTDSTATGSYAAALGDSTATGSYATAMGYDTTASGSRAVAMGFDTVSSGTASTAMGYTTTASGNYSTAIGIQNTAQAYASVVIGRYNEVSGNTTSWTSTDPLFVIGNGSSSDDRNDAFVVDKDGTIEVTGDITSDGEICIGSGC